MSVEHFNTTHKINFKFFNMEKEQQITNRENRLKKEAKKQWLNGKIKSMFKKMSKRWKKVTFGDCSSARLW